MLSVLFFVFLSIRSWKYHFYDSLCSTLGITCEDPPTVANAEMFGGGFVFEAHVHYTCREGYKMQGAADLACGEQGKWIGEVPVCTGKFQLYIRTSILVLSSLKVLFLQNACGFQVSSHESMQKTNSIRY